MKKYGYVLKDGVFHLNGKNIIYFLRNDYFNHGAHPVAHIEFLSLVSGEGNDISNTGYRSHFMGMLTDEVDRMIREEPEEVVRLIVESEAKEKGFKIKSFSFGAVETATQQTLF